MFEHSQGIVHGQGIVQYALALVAVVVLLGMAGPAAFAQSERANTAEFGIQIADLSGGSVSGINGAALDFSNDTAIGIVGGYNFTNRFAVGGEMTWADPAYKLQRQLDPSGIVVTVDAELDIATFLLKATFNFFETDFTPFVEAGAGWIRVDSNIADGAPTTGCWWDPWWGYMCTSFYDTYSDTRTGYTYAAGVRWDMGDTMLLRASYGVIEMDTNYAADNVDLDALRVEFAWKF